jgi:hypothetical protein
MKIRTTFLLLLIVLSLIAANRLFAPITETVETPKPTPPRPSAENPNREPSKFRNLFAGTWRGTIHMEVSGLGTQKYDDAYIIQIDPTETVITLLTTNSQVRYAVTKQGRAISWSGTENVNMNDQLVTFAYAGKLTLLKDDTAASFVHSTEKLSGFVPAKTVQSGIVRKLSSRADQ